MKKTIKTRLLFATLFAATVGAAVIFTPVKPTYAAHYHEHNPERFYENDTTCIPEIITSVSSSLLKVRAATPSAVIYNGTGYPVCGAYLYYNKLGSPAADEKYLYTAYPNYSPPAVIEWTLPSAVYNDYGTAYVFYTCFRLDRNISGNLINSFWKHSEKITYTVNTPTIPAKTHYITDCSAYRDVDNKVCFSVTVDTVVGETIYRCGVNTILGKFLMDGIETETVLTVVSVGEYYDKNLFSDLPPDKPRTFSFELDADIQSFLIIGEKYLFTVFFVWWTEDISDTVTLDYTYTAAEIPLPPAPELLHHTFAGWYLDTELTQAYDGRPIYENTALYAKFIPLTYHISFITNYLAINYSDMSVTALTAAGALPAPNRTGYTFTGWYTDAACTQEYIPITEMTGNVTLYAGWVQIILTVTFYVNGSVYAAIPVPYGATLAEAVSAAQSNIEIISGLYSDYNMQNILSVNTVLTGDMNVYAEVSAGAETKPGFFKRVGNWFTRNWPYFPVAAGCFGVGMLTLFIIQKKKGVI